MSCSLKVRLPQADRGFRESDLYVVAKATGYPTDLKTLENTFGIERPHPRLRHRRVAVRWWRLGALWFGTQEAYPLKDIGARMARPSMWSSLANRMTTESHWF